MNIKVVSSIVKANLGELETFVSSHENSNFFQSTKAYDFFSLVENYEPNLFVAYNGNEIVGSLLAIVIKEGGGLKAFFSRRCIVWGGPLVKNNDQEVNEKLISELNKKVSRKAIYTEFRNFFDMSKLKKVFLNNGFKFDDHLNMFINLEQSQDELWSNVHSKRRNEIRRAEREGTTFGMAQTQKDIRTTYLILTEVYNRAELPLPSLKFFQEAFHFLGKEYFKVFLAINDGKTIGTMYSLCYGNTVYDWYAGAYQDYYNKYPNDLVPWKVFLWGKERGYKKFDFGGAGKPGIPYGVRDYKKKFGGEIINLGRFINVHSPFLYSIGKVGLKFYKKFF